MKNSLPRGLRLDHGYVQVRLKINGSVYCKNFGPDSPLARELGSIHLAEKRREVLMGKAGLKPELPQKRFEVVCALWLPLWAQERDGDGRIMHDEAALYERKRVIDKELVPAFGSLYFDEINTIHIENWREARLAKGNVLGTTLNRYQGPLSAIFTDVVKWVKAGKIKPAFKLPLENPCLAATWAKARVRQRIYTEYELKKLKLAFSTLNDLDGWEICKLALKSVLSLKDLKGLEIGLIDTERSKTGVPVRLPITVLTKYSFVNWRSRWEQAREQAGLVDAQFRDLRKTGINMLTGRHDQKLVSQFAGHASTKTTEHIYQLKVNDKLRPLAEDLEQQIEGL